MLLYSTVRNGPMSSVGVDNYLGGYIATEHLVHLGHTRIAMLAGSVSFSDRSFHRWRGFRQCLRKNHISYDPSLVVQTQCTLESGKQGIKTLLSVKQIPTCVFCSNDLIALGAIAGPIEMGFSIPSDLSVVGFDDMPISSFMRPSLMTIKQPAYEMGQIGTQVVLSHIKKTNPKPVHRILPTTPLVRESKAGVTR